jgi:hypothetical protein
MKFSFKIEPTKTVFGKLSGYCFQARQFNDQGESDAEIVFVETKAKTKEKCAENTFSYFYNSCLNRYFRSYRVVNPQTIFCFYWTGASWGYDIVNTEKNTHSSCFLSPDCDKVKALEMFNNHADSYTN